ncbi:MULTISPECIES: glutamine synthetase family protein [unclassified Leptolyngbya]|uniref:glutamine synthetase family protein n=1 Tax=unclassified Leptolyngbya TaxID=2650499 RepID=UPI0016831ADF|nr:MULTISPECIES: glutamine synthetase family protein [unclassified Leptolyngbya]MBD1911775.1 glutamine synthetase [Leptolyngbya sp. FACHB-8]MBD2153335.1 glutamine synthetase [Leptolyngbya sp. FACHB-16]
MNKLPPRGMLTVEELIQLVEDEHIETILTVFPDLYGRLMGKRITGHYFVNDVLKHSVHACDYLLACDMEMDPVPGYAFTSWATGYGDFRLVPDLSTLRRASWLEDTAIVLCDVINEEEDVPVAVAPRNILKHQLAIAHSLGYTLMGASELELYVFNDTFEEARAKNYHDLEPIGHYIEDYHIFQGTKEEFVIGEIRKHLDRSGIPVEFSKGEWGPGQQEINLRYADFLEMCDRHVLYKHAAKEIAWLNEVAITFMAKWDERYAGSSMHLHVSLWDKAGEMPLFPGDEPYGKVHGSPLFRWFLGGWMAHIREIFAFYAPYPTSYKRYVAGSFAPTGIACSYDNRTAGFRVLGHGPALRIECRAPGADANPYLAYAVTLAAGLDGIKNQIEPPPMFEGDVYEAQGLQQVPKTLNEAIHELSKSEWVRVALGNEVVEHYLHFFRTEQRKFDEIVTSWERARYFERA